MAIVTIQSQIGGGGQELGPEVARRLGADYIDRLILAEAGKRVGATVEALEEKEQRVPRLGERLVHLFQRALERSAYSGMGGEPFFDIGMDALLTRPYPEETQEPVTRAQEIDDTHFFEVISEVIRDLAKDRNVVILGRGANLILKGDPKALHIGVMAPLSSRIDRYKERESLDQATAERRLTSLEKARITYFARHFKVNPTDPTLYHLVVNLSLINLRVATETIVNAASLLEQGE